MSRLNKKYLHSWIHPKLELKTISKVDKGVFAKENIKRKTLLVIFGGYIFTFKEELTFEYPLLDLAHQISPEFVIGVRKKSELQPIDYINHSCDPNVGFKGQIFLVAMRNIKKGEQICFDYCMVLSKAKGVKGTYRFKCHCGSSFCRKIITWNDWKITLLQKKYCGYFQWYLEEKIKERKNI